MGKDYYKTLNVEKGASQDDVKKAFRKLAHEYHPDKPTGNEDKFKEINEAYQILGDEEKRQQYDQFGSGAFDGSQGFSGGAGPDFAGQHAGFEDLGDILGGMFGSGGGGRGARIRRGSDIQKDIDLSFRDMVFGVEKSVSITKPHHCDRCAGTGGEPEKGMRTCEDCGGQGVKISIQRTILGNIKTKHTCSSCDGQGDIPKEECTSCHGSGIQMSKKTLNVHIPAGVDDGVMVRVRGEGEAIKGGQTGDLLLRLHIERDARFRREGDNIRSVAWIGFTQAALGDKISHDTVDGSVNLKIPAGTQSGTELRLRGKGINGRRGRGDQIVTINVRTPKKLNRHQKKLMEELNLTEE